MMLARTDDPAGLVASMSLESRARAMARARTLPEFIARVSPAYSPTPPHLLRLVEAVEYAAGHPGTRLVVSMPPRHGKTVTLRHALAWYLSAFPRRFCAYVTYEAGRARTNSQRILDLYRRSGGRVRPGATAMTEWHTTAGGGLRAIGVRGGLTGEGITGLMVIDDPIKDDVAAESALQRERLFDWWDATAQSRIEPSGSVVLCMARWHSDDLAGRLLRGTGRPGELPWTELALPALDDDTDEALWAEGGWTLDALTSLRASMTPYRWNALYMQRPQPREGRMFSELPTRFEGTPQEDFRRVIVVDPAGSERRASDATAAVVLDFWGRKAEDVTANLRDVLVLHARAAQAASALDKLAGDWGVSNIYIEGSRDGHSIAEALVASGLRTRVTFITPRGDKLTRADSAAAAWNAGRIRVPQNAPWLGAFLDEVIRFAGPSPGHDDQVDALAYAWLLALVNVGNAGQTPRVRIPAAAQAIYGGGGAARVQLRRRGAASDRRQAYG